MDGVLCDWEKQFKLFSGGLSIDTYKAKFGSTESYNFVLNNCPEFYASMPWMPDGRLLYNFIKPLNCEILSHATDPKAKSGKKQWLKSNEIEFKANLVTNREDKAKYANSDSILIDDMESNVNEFIKAGGKAILHKDATSTINQLKQLLGMKETHRIYNSILNPDIWDSNDNLKPEIQQSLLTIANEFYKETELTAPIIDIYLLGSSAGYNWTPTSDMDLHVLIDFKKVNPDKELVKKYVDGLKSKWNENHNIRIANHPVEVYIQDSDETNRSQAVYSVLKNEWIKKPTYENITIDKDAIKKKYYQYTKAITNAINAQNMDTMKQLVKRMYEMRETGLSSVGEYSTENIVFKLLRSTGYIGRLREAIKANFDKNLSKL